MEETKAETAPAAVTLENISRNSCLFLAQHFKSSTGDLHEKGRDLSEEQSKGVFSLVKLELCRVLDCDWQCYLNRYQDLQNVYGYNLEQMQNHYITDGIIFFANRQFILRISKNYKKIDFGRFLMHISLYEGTGRDKSKNASEGYLYG